VKTKNVVKEITELPLEEILTLKTVIHKEKLLCTQRGLSEASSTVKGDNVTRPEGIYRLLKKGKSLKMSTI
jgi:hypothetical protein